MAATTPEGVSADAYGVAGRRRCIPFGQLSDGKPADSSDGWAHHDADLVAGTPPAAVAPGSDVSAGLGGPFIELLTIAQAADALNVPRSWLRDKVTARQVPHARLGRHVRFSHEHLRQIIADSEEPAFTERGPTGGRHRRRG